MAHESLLQREETTLVVVDIQEKLLPSITDCEKILANNRILISAAKTLGIPIIVTEQYPKGLGATESSLSQLLEGTPQVEKLSFSCVGSDTFLDLIEDIGRDQAVICGIESHVCVLQTALDLIENGLQVHVPADATGSRNPNHPPVALERIRQAGGIVTVVESVLFEWLRVAGTEEFKTISRLIR